MNKQEKVGLMLTNSPLVLSGQRCDRSSGQTRKALRELVVEPHEEEVAPEASEGGEEGGGGRDEVHLRRGGRGQGQGGSWQRTQLLPIALCHPLQKLEFNSISFPQSCSENKTHPMVVVLQ